MIDRDIILQKIDSIQNCLTTISKATDGNSSKLDNQIIQDAVVLNLQRAVQICLDIGSYMIAKLKWGLPASLAEIFAILHQHEVIDKSLMQKMIKMVGFRNIAVHEYKKLNLDILKKIITEHLIDFEEFYRTVLQYCDR